MIATLETRIVNLSDCSKSAPICTPIPACDCRTEICGCEPANGVIGCLNIWNAIVVSEGIDIGYYYHYQYVGRVQVHRTEILITPPPCQFKPQLWKFNTFSGLPINALVYISPDFASNCILQGQIGISDTVMPGLSNCVPGNTFDISSLGGFALNRYTGRVEGPTCSPFGWYGMVSSPAIPTTTLPPCTVCPNQTLTFVGPSLVPANYCTLLLQLVLGDCTGAAPADFDGPHVPPGF